MPTNLNVQISECVLRKGLTVSAFFFILYIEQNKSLVCSLANFIVLAGIISSFKIYSCYKL